CGPTHRASTREMSVPSASLGGSPSVAARSRKGRSSSCAPARSTRSCARSRRTVSSRCYWRAGRRLPRRSSPPVSSTSCSSSSRPSWPGTGRVYSATSRRRSSSSTSARSPRERTCCWRRTYASRNLGGMFTGIVRELGTVDAFDGSRLVVAAPETAAGAAVGDSVAVAGVCLTVVEAADGRLAFDVVPETLSRTALGRLEPGGEVNVEPSLRVGDQLGGHVVQGHVDAVGRVRSVAPEGDSRRVWVDAPESVLGYTIEKGSIAVDGVSLTVAAFDDDGFEVALIPHTLAVTTLGRLEPADEV